MVQEYSYMVQVQQLHVPGTSTEPELLHALYAAYAAMCRCCLTLFIPGTEPVVLRP